MSRDPARCALRLLALDLDTACSNYLGILRRQLSNKSKQVDYGSPLDPWCHQLPGTKL